MITVNLARPSHPLRASQVYLHCWRRWLWGGRAGGV